VGYLKSWSNFMIDLLSFQIATRLNSQNNMKMGSRIKSDTLICIWILVIPFGIIEDTTPRKWSFWLYTSSLHDYWPPSPWNISRGWNVEKWNTCFSAPKNAKKVNQLKQKIQVRNRLFIDIWIFEYVGLYFLLWGVHIKFKPLH
jgi:hypothetical protein